jgi:hypothetical protein
MLNSQIQAQGYLITTCVTQPAWPEGHLNHVILGPGEYVSDCKILQPSGCTAGHTEQVGVVKQYKLSWDR